jgi:hypothetical protein
MSKQMLGYRLIFDASLVSGIESGKKNTNVRTIGRSFVRSLSIAAMLYK